MSELAKTILELTAALGELAAEVAENEHHEPTQWQIAELKRLVGKLEYLR